MNGRGEAGTERTAEKQVDELAQDALLEHVRQDGLLLFEHTLEKRCAVASERHAVTQRRTLFEKALERCLAPLAVLVLVLLLVAHAGTSSLMVKSEPSLSPPQTTAKWRIARVHQNFQLQM